MTTKATPRVDLAGQIVQHKPTGRKALVKRQFALPDGFAFVDVYATDGGEYTWAADDVVGLEVTDVLEQLRRATIQLDSIYDLCKRVELFVVTVPMWQEQYERRALLEKLGVYE